MFRQLLAGKGPAEEPARAQRNEDGPVKDETHHGPPGDRRFDYVPLYILRGLEALHIEFATP